MQKPTWQRVSELYDAALDLPPGAREAFVEEACGSDRALLGELRSLLRAQGADLLDGAPFAPLSELISEDPHLGRSIGPYRLDRCVGQGGMGAVYRATREDGQFRQVVAVKLIRPGHESEAVLARFRAERQILASLDHPHIARLLDGGLTADGQPYLVMEFVEDGVPIDVYCDRSGLGLAERLRLFQTICAAVAHAHRKLVVHRDLKPSNILVGPDGRPKLLDFGVAKVIDPIATRITVAETRAGVLPLTLGCASPEQVKGEAITTSSDVYSLGVLLYRLLAGCPPYALDGLGLAEVIHRICETQPIRPSQAASQGPTPERARLLRGDLDSIVMKALRKDPADRYATVEALSADLQCFLDARPVRARAETPAYLARKFVQRNRIWVGAAGLVALALLVAVAGTSWQAAVAGQERDRARIEAQRASRMSELLEGLFVQVDPARKPGADSITALELLDRGERMVTEDLAAEPDEQADLLAVLGRVHFSLGAFERAADLHTRALAIRRGLYTDPHDKIAESLGDLSAALLRSWERESALTAAREAHAQRLRLHGPDDPRTLQSAIGLAQVLTDETGTNAASMTEALALYTDTLERQRAHLGEVHADVAESLFGLGEISRFRGEYRKAADRYAQAAVVFGELGEDHAIRRADALEGLTVSLAYAGDLGARYQAAVAEALAIKERILGPEHPFLIDSIINAGAADYAAGRYDSAQRSYDRALALQRRVWGEDEGALALVMSNKGMAWLYAGELEAARGIFEEALAIRLRVHGPTDVATASIQGNLARVLLAQGELDRAEELARAALATREAELGAHEAVARDLAVLGAVLRARDKHAEAVEVLVRSIDLYERLFAEGHYKQAMPDLLLAEERILAGEPAEAERLARHAVALREAALVEGHWMIQEARSVLRASLAAQGRKAEAGPILEKSRAALEGSLGAAHYATVAALDRLSAGGGQPGRP